MYFVINNGNNISISDFGTEFNNSPVCCLESLNNFDEVVEDWLGTSDLKDLTIFKLEGSLTQVTLQKQYKEVLCEVPETKKQAPKNDPR